MTKKTLIGNDIESGTPVDNSAVTPPDATANPDEEQRASIIEQTEAYGDAARRIVEQPIEEPPKRATTYEDLERALHPDPRPSFEQMLADEKRERRNRMIASIGGFATALSNMGTTMAGAPNIQMGDATKPYNESMERLRRTRKEHGEQWEDRIATAVARDDKNYSNDLAAYNKRQQYEMKQRQQASKLMMDIADRLRRAEEAMAKGDRMKAQTLADQARAAKLEAEANGYDKYMDARTKSLIAKAEASYAQAAKARSGSGKTKGYEVDGVQYDHIDDAYLAIPKEYQTADKDDSNASYVQGKKDAVARYNADKRRKGAQSGNQQTGSKKKSIGGWSQSSSGKGSGKKKLNGWK